MSLLVRIPTLCLDMPVLGLFALIRQPIYVVLAMTLWTVPGWTPDQLLLAVLLTAYCPTYPNLKERHFVARLGQAFGEYRGASPYFAPRFCGGTRQSKQ